jgi:hypothetical protein
MVSDDSAGKFLIWVEIELFLELRDTINPPTTIRLADTSASRVIKTLDLRVYKIFFIFDI